MNQPDAQLLTNNLYFFLVLLYMFWTYYLSISSLDGAPDDGLVVCLKHVEQNKKKIKIICKKLCIWLVHLHTTLVHYSKWCIWDFWAPKQLANGARRIHDEDGGFL